MKIGALKNKIKGPTFSIVTPFKKDGNIDYSTLFKNLTFYYKNGVRIFYLMFYNSRLGLLSEEEVFKLNYKIAKFLKKKYSFHWRFKARRFGRRDNKKDKKTVKIWGRCI